MTEKPVALSTCVVCGVVIERIDGWIHRDYGVYNHHPEPKVALPSSPAPTWDDDQWNAAESVPSTPVETLDPTQPVAPNCPLDEHHHKPGEWCQGCADLMSSPSAPRNEPEGGITVSDKLTIELHEGKWKFEIRDDGYRWWMRKLSELPLNIDTEEHCLIEYKHSNAPAADSVMGEVWKRLGRSL